MGGEGKVVCVTGASGYIASWLVKQLLQLGYTVKATVRDPNDPKKTEHLLALDGAKERLHFFKASLLEEGSFDFAVDGCDGVFHTASPVLFSTNDPQVDIVDTAVKGTLNVLKSCAKSPSVKRVIYTSSIAAVMYNEKPITSDTVVDETWFSDPAVCKKAKKWYALSKTLAESAAWKFTEENGIDLVTLNSGLTIGTLLQPTLNISVEIILKLVNGDQSYPSPYKLVDVKDVSHAHIQALELPSASGRYCIVESIRSSTETLKILQKLFPTLHLPTKLEDKKPNEPTYKVSRERAESLGINFISWEVSLKDTIESFKEKGFLTF
ncbi:hypothetical protein EZV62_017152 [Acer yangbiense]|uniref:NAD-dependent epimerase/dehydratase domain-containing protein n=1 Tax=Acer yangbiense TaxID=1000413 RepID=A0A5C7HG81_9ROSI|nr:hypothetical protein EZV62_017152 [Acer yangbiense]